jgi:uncharacterized protein (DUF433 family)
MRIVETDGVLGGKPRLDGHRISVLQIAELVIDAGETPETVADQLDITLAAVHYALAYYYDNIEEMDRLRERRTDLLSELASESNAPDAIEQ